MNATGFRFELRLGRANEDMVRVSVPTDTLMKSSVESARYVLFEAAVTAFRTRAHLAGHDPAAIDAEVARFESAVARTRS